MPITNVRCEWVGGLQRFYMADTYETVSIHAPGEFQEDFLGSAILTGGTTIWSVVDVSGAGDSTPKRVANGENGVYSVMLDTGQVEDEDSVLYWGDEKGINVKDGCIFEMRVNVSVLPTGVAVAVFGLNGDHALVKDASTEHAWFRLDAATTASLLVAETDDTNDNNDDISTGVTIVAGEWNIFRIDSTDISDVKFFVNGARVAKATTFDMSTLTDAEGIMQPYFAVDKTNSNDAGTLQIDSVKAWWKRA